MAWYDFLIGKEPETPTQPLADAALEAQFPSPKDFPRDKYDGYWELYPSGPNHTFVRVMRRSREELLGEQMLINSQVSEFILNKMDSVKKEVQ